MKVCMYPFGDGWKVPNRTRITEVYGGEKRDQEKAGTSTEFGSGRTLFVFFWEGVQVPLQLSHSYLDHWPLAKVNENACSFPQMSEAQ